MSRPAAATQQKPEPRIRRARFAEEDLVSTFGEATLAEARRLLGAGLVRPTGRAVVAGAERCDLEHAEDAGCDQGLPAAPLLACPRHTALSRSLSETAGFRSRLERPDSR
jgi:hypothetical protein